jgi:hypothetical protein
MAKKKKVSGNTPDFVKIYSPAQGAAVGSPVTILIAVRKTFTGTLGLTVTPLGGGGLAQTMQVALGPGGLCSQQVNLMPGTTLIEVQSFDGSGTLTASDQLIVTH